MPLHLFGPPHLHVLPVVLTSALALAAAAYAVTRNGRFAGLGNKIKARVAALRAARANSDSGPLMFSRGHAASKTTGNRAFEDYRAATLEKLESEGAEFRAYLDGLRHARDKSEFDAFMSERRESGSTGTPSP
ncbi:MAG: DUF2852 domain-containing protein [Hyphomicrobium sp.]|nr:DUF2852 domain-containing protein [Hyphomicrobium sp.]